MRNVLVAPEWLARVLVPLLVWVLAPCASAEVPRQIASSDPDRQQPVWVSADEAVADGRVKLELFSDFETQLMTSAARSGEREYQKKISGESGEGVFEDGCIWVSVGHSNVRENYPLERLHRQAAGAFLGRVVDGAQGFLYGRAGTLFEVEVLDEVKTSNESVVLERLFVYYPHARINFGHFSICKSGPRYPTKPLVGGKVIVYAWESLAQDAAPIVRPEDEEIFFELEDGTISLPQRYGEIEGDLSLEQLVRKVQDGS